MQDRIRNFIHNNDHYYTSYDGAKCLMIFVCWFITLIVGTYAIVAKLWLSIIALAVINCLFLLHIIFLKFFLKNNYELRFWSEGVINTLLSALFLISAYTILFATKCDTDFVKYGTLIVYITFEILYGEMIIYHSKSCKDDHPSSKVHFLSIGSLIPVSGVIGMVIAKIIFRTLDLKNETVVYIAFIAFIVTSMIFSLGWIDFIKYFYCKKYNIDSDNKAQKQSPALIPTTSRKKSRQRNIPKTPEPESKSAKKKKSRTLKVIIGILSVPIALYIIVFIIFLIKAILTSN